MEPKNNAPTNLESTTELNLSEASPLLAIRLRAAEVHFDSEGGVTVGKSQGRGSFFGEEFIDLGMPWNGGSEIACRVTSPRMVAAFADKNTSVGAEMPDEFAAFHTRMAASS